MKKTLFACWFFVAAACFGQTSQALCPRHIESPDYPALARTAHVTGKITLTVTIDADGVVTHVEATGGLPFEEKHPLLRKYAAGNMQHWTFAKPPTAPFTQIIVYDFELDETLPASGGRHSAPSLTKTNFDLPDRVTILTNQSFVEPASAKHQQK